MKGSEAEKLLGGHATGTLTEEEQRTLFAAALGHQAIFDALMDEEALRELLADPVAKAQLMAALSSAPPKVVPFWRRTGVLGAAAGLIIAATAGLAYLRNPDRTPPPLARETEKPADKAAETPAQAGAQPSVVSATKTAPAELQKETTSPHPAAKVVPPLPPQQMTAAPTAGASASVEEAAHRNKAKADVYRAEAQANLAKKAEAPRPAAAAVEVVAAQKEEVRERKAETRDRLAGGTPGGMPGGVIGGVVGGVVGGVASKAPASDQAGKLRAEAAPPPVAVAPDSAKPHRRIEGKAGAEFRPSWTLESQPDGSTLVLVKGPVGAQAVLLRRRATGVEVLALRLIDASGDLAQWRVETRLSGGDVLDLYLLNAPVADSARLPETGPVDGFRARVYPASKN